MYSPMGREAVQIGWSCDVLQGLFVQTCQLRLRVLAATRGGAPKRRSPPVERLRESRRTGAAAFDAVVKVRFCLALQQPNMQR